MNAMTRTQRMIIGSLAMTNIRYLNAERVHVRKQVRDLKRDGYWSVMTAVKSPWNGSFLSIDEACHALRNLLTLERAKRGHWSYDTGRYVAMRQRYVIARYFRRFGRTIWTGHIQ